MPNLGKYADTVLSAYGVTLLLLALLVGVTLWRGHRVRAEMEQIERRVKKDG